MELKKDCIRDILIFCEKNLSYQNSIKAHKIVLKKFSTDDIVYTCDKLSEVGIINVIRGPSVDGCLPYIDFKSLSYYGHQILDNIKSPKIWNATKDKLKTMGSFSIDIMAKFAATLITQKLGI